MRTRLTGSALALLSLVILASACETGTGPDAGDTFRATLEDYKAVDAAFASSAWASFQALGNRTPYGASAAIDLVGALSNPQSLAAHAEGPAGAPIISTSHRGKTFVYDPARDEYVVDPQRTGAPAKGVRLIIYKVDSSGRPIVGQETGRADLIDEGDGSAQDVALRFTIVQNNKTVLDYRTTLDDGPTRGTLTVNGFLEPGEVKLEFDIEATGRKQPGGGELDVAFEIAVDARDFSIVGDVSGARDGVAGEGDIDVTVRHRDGSIRLDASGENGVLDATVFVNGEVFATVEGHHRHPTILGKGGQPITGIELLVLGRIMDSVEDVFDLLEDLLDPVDDLVFWGIVL